MICKSRTRLDLKSPVRTGYITQFLQKIPFVPWDLCGQHCTGRLALAARKILSLFSFVMGRKHERFSSHFLFELTAPERSFFPKNVVKFSKWALLLSFKTVNNFYGAEQLLKAMHILKTLEHQILGHLSYTDVTAAVKTVVYKKMPIFSETETKHSLANTCLLVIYSFSLLNKIKLKKIKEGGDI